MILSDRTLEWMLETARLTISPFPSDDQIQPASIDLRLGNDFQVFPSAGAGWVVDPQKNNSELGSRVKCVDGDKLIFMSGTFALGTTRETVKIPHGLVARVEGKSSLARLGLAVHATAGFIDPGFQGQITLEFSNLSPYDIMLRPGMKIAQISFEKLDQICRRPYGHPALNSKYQGQQGATASAYHQNKGV